MAAIGRMCRARDILYLVDACQSVGQMPVEPAAMGCDFLSATARKFLRGPRGSGFLWVSDRVLDAGLEPLFPDLRGADWIDENLYQPAPDARRFETWEFAWALVLGTGAAARYAMEVGLEATRDRVRHLAGRLREELAALPGVRILDRGARARRDRDASRSMAMGAATWCARSAGAASTPRDRPARTRCWTTTPKGSTGRYGSHRTTSTPRDELSTFQAALAEIMAR